VAESQNKKKKRRTGWWVSAIILLLAGAAIGWRILSTRQKADQALANLETEPYQRRNLNANIYGTGTVQPNQTALLTWSAKGVVGKVNVALGDPVKKDMLLMSLDPVSLSVDILQAEIDVINAQKNLDDLYDNWESELAQAKLDLLNAEQDLEDLERERSIMNYQRCTDERIEELEDDLEMAENLYKIRQTTENLRLVNTAQANLDYCQADYSERDIAEAELEVTLAENQVADLQDKVDLLQNGPDPDQVKIYETQLAIAESRRDSSMIEAPFDGVVTVLSAKTGDLIQAGQQAVRIDDLSERYLNVNISEIDIPYISIGQPAGLIFDAYFESRFSGEVSEIAPVGESTQGVVEYTVRINLSDTDARIKPGMTAAVNIVVEEKRDVLVVPNDAIVSIDGKETVYVKRGGTYEAVVVTLGSYSDVYSEVIQADIDVGELIVLNPPPELTGVMPFSGPPTGGFGGFGN